MPYFGNNPSPLLLNTVAQNGKEMTLDADADTSITADTDDQIDIKIGGADDFQFTANTFTAQSGSTIAAQALTATTITASGIIKTDDATDATTTTDGSLQTDGGLSVVKDAVIGDDLLMLSDSAAIKFGADSDVTVTHDPDDGLILKSTATGDDNPFLLTLQTGETDLAANDVIGKIAFQAPDEGTGTDAILVSGAIQARAEGDHSASSNATSLDFMTGSSEAATTKMTLTSAGNLQLGSANDFSGIQDTLQLGDSQEFRLYHNSGGGNSVSCILSTANSMQIFTDVIRVGSADNTENLFGADKDAGFFCKHNNNTGMSLTDSDGSGVRLNFVANMTSTNLPANNVRGVAFGKEGDIEISSISDNLPLDVNRGNDGAMIRLRSAATSEGQISISGSTTSYGAFTGTHWSRLIDNSKPNILRGTVMETIDEMCDWYSVEFDLEIKYALDVDKIPEGKKVGDVKETLTVKRDIGLLPNGKSVGDTMTYTEDGVEYTGTILKQGDEKHVKTKISDTAECTNVYGVFMSWDEDDDTVNDMNVASLGTMVVRIHKDQTVSKGDLLTSNGDGTAKKQSDDIIRTKTIGKVLTNIKQETYSDGSYTVPCALYCG